MDYKFLITCAGTGSRVSNFSKHLNKSLLTIGRKPVISHIIDKIDPNVEIVVCLGYKGDLLKQFLDVTYPDRVITYVVVDKFEGEGSGLGYTILKAKDHLQCPFIFCSNDTIIDGEFIEPKYNYVHFSSNVTNQNRNYRTVTFDDDNILLSLNSKDAPLSETFQPYIGLAGIKDFELFWSSMQSCDDLTIGESYAISDMIKDVNVKCINSHWYDTGNADKLKDAIAKFKKDDHINVLEKHDENIWFVNKSVIKFHIDKKFISDRVLRASILEDYIPKIKTSSENFYAYDIFPGHTFTYEMDETKFIGLLNWMKSFWVHKDLNQNELSQFKNTCTKFYKDKTYNRVDEFFMNTEHNDSESIINGVKYPSIQTLLNSIDWNSMSDGIPTRVHGDLHFENIIVGSSGYKLIDWRQDFGGLIDYGDIYYDLAKIKHGLIMSHDVVVKELYEVSEDLSTYSFFRKHSLVKYEKLFDEFVVENNLDLYKVNILTALIYLNVACLHHHPYSNLLICLGKTMLSETLNNKDWDCICHI